MGVRSVAIDLTWTQEVLTWLLDEAAGSSIPVGMPRDVADTLALAKVSVSETIRRWKFAGILVVGLLLMKSRVLHTICVGFNITLLTNSADVGSEIVLDSICEY